MNISSLLLSLCAASFAAAGVVITPIRPNQVIPSTGGDCAFGVTTPVGCGPLRSK